MRVGGPQRTAVDVGKNAFGGRTRGGQELMETAHHVHPQADDLEHEAALAGRQHATRRRNSVDEAGGYSTGERHGLGEVSTDGNRVRLLAQHVAGIEPSLFRVDDREDFVTLRVPDQSVGCLAVKTTEVGFAVDDGGLSIRRLAPRAAQGQRARTPDRRQHRRPVARARREGHGNHI